MRPAPEYELVLMLDPEVPDERRDQIAIEARRRIEDAGALKQERSWGLRKMSYEINQRTEADYRFFRFEKGGSVLDELNHNLRITDGVLRFRIFKVDPRVPVVDPPPPISLAATAAPRTGGRGRRDDRHEDRPPRAPEPEAPAAAAPAEPAPAAPAAPEAPAAEPAPEASPEPVAEAPAAGPATEPAAETAPEPEAPAAEPAAPEPAEGDGDSEQA